MWINDKDIIREKRSVGRPVINPFPSKEVEEDFVVRGRKMIELYYDFSNPSSKLNFVFDEGKRISKTLFWSYIYIFYVAEKGVQRNVQGFLEVLVRNFESKTYCDRTTLQRSISSLDKLYLTHRTPSNDQATARAQEKHRPQFDYVIELWTNLIEC